MLKTKKLFDDLVIAVEKHLPEIRQLLQPPATNKDLKVLKDHLPNLPEQLMELLRCSNGQKPGTDGANLFGVFSFLDAEQIYNQLQPEHFQQEIDSPTAIVADDRIQSNYLFRSKWLTIGDASPSPFRLIVDCDPSDSGNHGQIFEYEPQTGPRYVIAKDVNHFLEITTRKIQNVEFEPDLGMIALEYEKTN